MWNNGEYEGALNEYIDRLLGDARFVVELEEFVGGIVVAGRVNSLAQTLMKYTAPGVPDTYQGGELWDFSLVDPDNRRPVDYELRRKLLKEIESLSASQVMERSDEGLPKLWLVHHSLQLRNEHPEWFGAEAAYTPIVAEGSKSDHLIGYLRGDSVAVFAPRWPLRLGDNWSATSFELPQGQWKNILSGEALTGGRLRVQALLKRFPVALLRKGAE